jgi:hypothetical protein
MHRHRSFRRPRRAIASLELVLVLPFLVAIVSILFVVAKADVVKLTAVTDARRQSWLNRTSENAKEELTPLQHPDRSEVVGAPQLPVSLGPALGRGVQQATSRTTVVANAWNYPTVPFQSLPQNLQPHADVLTKMASTQGVDASKAAYAFKALLVFDPGSDPVLKGAAFAGQTGKVATDLAGEVLHIVDLLNDLGKGINVADTLLDAAQKTGVGGIIDGIGGLFGVKNPVEKLQDAIHQIRDAIDALDGLYRASQGRE